MGGQGFGLLGRMKFSGSSEMGMRIVRFLETTLDVRRSRSWSLSMLEIICKFVFEMLGDIALEFGAWTIGKFLCMLADLIKAISKFFE
jgi:hypothetical protein